VDHLAKRGLPHPDACPFCDQEDETVQHILVSCVFAREVWLLIFQRMGLLTITPQPLAVHFTSWWCKAIQGVDKELKKDLNSLIILVVWEILKHHNDCIFNGAQPSVTQVLQTVENECML
jgi:hypothetical protein